MITVDEFLSLYRTHLAAPDRPTCFVAYCRTESDVVLQYGVRKYANSKVWRSVMSRHYKNRKQQKQQHNEPSTAAAN